MANKFTKEHWTHVAGLLGREPRGLRDIPVLNEDGMPAVIRVASVVEGKPFPTLHWLVDADLCLHIDRLESKGWIARLQTQIDGSPTLRKAMIFDHKRYRELRRNYLSAEESQYLSNNNMQAALEERGIGGIAEPNRIRCLHTWYAAHLVRSNSVGSLVEEILDKGEYLVPS